MDAEKMREIWKLDVTKGLFTSFWNPHSEACTNSGARLANHRAANDGWEDQGEEGGGDDVEAEAEDVEEQAVGEEGEGEEGEADGGTTWTTASAPSVKSRRKGGGNSGRFPWKPQVIADRLRDQWASMGGNVSWKNVQSTINEVFDVPEGETCPDWKARKVFSLLNEGDLITIRRV